MVVPWRLPCECLTLRDRSKWSQRAFPHQGSADGVGERLYLLRQRLDARTARQDVDDTTRSPPTSPMLSPRPHTRPSRPRTGWSSTERAILREIDADGDGRVSEDELRAYLSRHQGMVAPGAAKVRVKRVDVAASGQEPALFEGLCGNYVRSEDVCNGRAIYVKEAAQGTVMWWANINGLMSWCVGPRSETAQSGSSTLWASVACLGPSPDFAQARPWMVYSYEHQDWVMQDGVEVVKLDERDERTPAGSSNDTVASHDKDEDGDAVRASEGGLHLHKQGQQLNASVDAAALPYAASNVDDDPASVDDDALKGPDYQAPAPLAPLVAEACPGGAPASMPQEGLAREGERGEMLAQPGHTPARASTGQNGMGRQLSRFEILKKRSALSWSFSATTREGGRTAV